MRLKYGNYLHDANEAEVTPSITRSFNSAGETLSVVARWVINGQLHADTPAALITRMRALEAAYARQFQDLVLYLDDGVTIHGAMLNRGSTTGVRILGGVDYPVGRGAEGGTFRTYSIIAEAAYEFDTAENGGGGNEGSDPNRIESWTETVTEVGGGPRYVLVEVVEGDPVRQLLNTRTKVRVTQSGQAVGRSRYPTPPGPIYPDSENPAERQISQTTPTMNGQTSTGYQISWTYVMEGPGLGGTSPTVWPK